MDEAALNVCVPGLCADTCFQFSWGCIQDRLVFIKPYEELPDCSPKWLDHFIFLPVMHEGLVSPHPHGGWVIFLSLLCKV